MRKKKWSSNFGDFAEAVASIALPVFIGLWTAHTFASSFLSWFAIAIPTALIVEFLESDLYNAVNEDY